MDWGYLAGFIDGEGCIKIYRGYARITIGQKEPEVLEAIRTFLGLQNAITLSRNCYYLQINATYDVRKVLEGIKPFAIVKRKDIEAVYELWNERGV